MKISFVISALFLLTLSAWAAKHPDFSGSWRLNAAKSQNIGMMTQMKMAQEIQQSDSALDVNTHTNFQGSDQDSKTHYDLSGKPTQNEAPMQGPSATVSKWQANKLLTTWTSPSAVAGKKIVREERRSLSPDGNTMTIESARGANLAIVMVFDRAQ